MKSVLGALLFVLLAGCRALEAEPSDVDPDLARLRATLEALYAAFGFDAGAEPDWAAQRALFLEGATFVAPIAPDRPPRGVDTATFIADFAGFVRTGPYAESGLYERILQIELSSSGDIAHAFVLFEGHLPGREEPETRGIDSIQLVRAEDRWKLVAFTTQYEREGLSLDLHRRTYP